jgi:hypothetical protein
MSSINELSLPEQNNIFIPNDRNHRGTSINDFQKSLFNTNGEFLDWNLNGSLNSKYGHSLFVKQGAIKYEAATAEDGGFILAQNTILQYNLTNRFPKKNLAIKMRLSSSSSKIDVDLGGFHLEINPVASLPNSNRGIYCLHFDI